MSRAAGIPAPTGRGGRQLASNISFNGRISMLVLALHTTGDGLVVPENEQAYAQVVRQAGNGPLLRQIFVSRAGHCTFTPAETIAAVQVLLDRVSSGRWHPAALSPEALNAAAAALGPAFNIFPAQGGSCPAGPPVNGVCPTAAAFVQYRPARFLRPYDLGTGQN